MEWRFVVVSCCLVILIAATSYVFMVERDEEDQDSVSSVPSEILVRDPCIDVIFCLSDMNLWRPGAENVTMWVSTTCAKLRHRRSMAIEEMEEAERRFFANLIEIEEAIDFDMVRRLFHEGGEQLDDKMIRDLRARGVHVVAKGELSRLAADHGEDWQEVQAEKLGKQLSLFHFSEPVFSKDNKVAIVVYSWGMGTLGFENGAVVLRNERGVWRFFDRVAWLFS